MRDLLLALILLVLCGYALRRPWIGVMGWTWISLMNPHALSWHLSSFPVAASIAGCTLLGAVFTKDKRDFSVTPEMGVLIVFMCWMCVTLPFSFSFDDSFLMWKRVMKIDFMILVSLVLLYSKKHLMTFIWVVVGSIGFYGVKGGIFTLATGGSYRVWGPAGTYIDGNNEMALALIIITPLFRFLQLQVASKWGKRTITISILLCTAAALGSQSRGALLAIVAMAAALWWYGGRRFGLLFGILFAAGIAFALMPETWHSRMDTIGEYQADSSAMGRINAWHMAWNLASDRFFGGGFEIYNRILFGLYAPVPEDVHAAHSIYFQVLGEHGFVGLFLFLTLWSLVWWNAGKLRKEARNQPETKWISDLGAMCQVSMVGYAVGGAFLSLAYFDLPYNILMMVILARRWVTRKGWLEEGGEQDANVAAASIPKTLVP
ncbi:MAG: putative O-glycosylation ligase, exosortase A system-associated [Sphingomonadales bacterium]|nr:putative O-glycosylation ligase, exosortase A system-associated [Sphingomonadales bacterium]